jgi:hypothetical protein
MSREGRDPDEDAFQARLALEGHALALEAEVRRLRAALDLFADRDNWLDRDDGIVWYAPRPPWDIAQAALLGTEDGG